MADRELSMQFYHPKQELTEETLNTITAEFVREADVMESSRALYKKSIKWLVSWLVEKRITLPTRTDIVAWKKEMQKNLKPRTVNVRLATTKAFFTWAESKFYYPNIAARVKKLTIATDTYAKEALSQKKLTALLQSIHRDRILGKRDYAIVLLCARTAIRTLEVSEINVEDIRVYEGTDNPKAVALLWLRRKGRTEKDRYVVLSEEVVNALGDYLQARTVRGDDLASDSPLFVSESMNNSGARVTDYGIQKAIRKRMGNVFTQHDLAKIVPHSLRHTGITMALQGGASLQDAQAMAGHRSISTTMIYAQNLERIKNAAEIKVGAYANKVKELPTNPAARYRLLRSDNISFNEPVNLDPEELARMMRDMATGRLSENERSYVKKYLEKFVETY